MNDLLIIGLGSNLNPRRDYLKEARQKVSQQGKINETSTIIETEPWGVDTDHKFLNQVVSVENITLNSGESLLKWLLKIEQDIGRDRKANAPDRVIDIDILYWGNRVIVGNPIVPHPRLHRRGFVLKGLVEIVPRFVHPVFKKTQQQLLNSLD
ncbi:MAG: 2-amino-4-hydroxy-6-hydroxymethyldihydropteridine diphosphokinase [bacterium]